MPNKESHETLLSIVVPVSKIAGKSEFLKSWIFEVDYNLVEVLLVHDVQDDQTSSEIHSIIASAPNVKIFERQVNSPGAARNIGIENASGKYITFWDADDYPDYQEYVHESLRLNSLNGDCSILNFETEVTSQNCKAVLHENNLLFVAFNPGIWRWIFRRESLSGINFPKLRMAEDQVFLARYLEHQREIIFSERVSYRYMRSGPHQLTRNPDALVDLIESAHFTSGLIRNSQNLSFTFILFMRQCLTGIKKGYFPVKYKLFAHLFRVILISPKQFQVAIFAYFKFYKSSKQMRDDSNPEILVSLTGGLGNQLFQLAAGLYKGQLSPLKIEWDLGKPRKNSQGFPEIKSFKLPAIIGFDNIRKNSWIYSKAFGYLLRTGFSPSKLERNQLYKTTSKFAGQVLFFFRFRVYRKLHISNDIGYSDFDMQKRSHLIGYFQSYVWTQRKEVFEFLKNLSIGDFPEYRKFIELSNIEKPLVVHIRLTDYLEEGLIGIPSVKYYENAIGNQLKSGRYNKIWAFSDDPAQAANWLKGLDSNLIRWIPKIGDSDLNSFELMRLGHGYVIANSTFSWWAARLSHSSNPIVIYPKPWFRSMKEPNKLMPPEWLPESSGWNSH
jgi:glycosyltransferase involved in cell wall biosynthesis